MQLKLSKLKKHLLNKWQSKKTSVKHSLSLTKPCWKLTELVKRLRHETGGHLDDGAFKKALESISLETQVLFQSGSSPKTLHYKFCLEFLGAIISS